MAKPTTNRTRHRRQTAPDDLTREAFGVRPACWRCREAGVVRKREQAPRTPNASRSSVAALPALRSSRLCGSLVRAPTEQSGLRGRGVLLRANTICACFQRQPCANPRQYSRIFWPEPARNSPIPSLFTGFEVALVELWSRNRLAINRPWSGFVVAITSQAGALPPVYPLYTPCIPPV
jgi:hypothetical protein